MSRWARSAVSSAATSSPNGDWPAGPRPNKKKGINASNKLEKSIHRLEEALAGCETDDDYKSILELYSIQIQRQRRDIKELLTELEITKVDALLKEKAREETIQNQVERLHAEIEAREKECAEERLRGKELSSQVEKLQLAQKKVENELKICLEHLKEERRWRGAAIGCLRSELKLAKETATQLSILKNNTNTSQHEVGLTNDDLKPSNSSGRPRSAPCRSPEAVVGERLAIDRTEQLVLLGKLIKITGQ